MARYTSLYTATTHLDRLRQLLADVLSSCDCSVIYDTEDYLMAKEVPGNVSYAQLVTVEVLIDRVPDTSENVRMNFVVKNEELPLKSDNHCRRMFNRVNRAVSSHQQWNLVESAAG